MADITAPRSIADALAEVARRQGEEQARHAAELGEVDQEIASLRTAMTNLQQQLDALARFRDELAGRIDSVAGGGHRLTYDAIFHALHEQSQALSGRAARVAEAARAQQKALADTLEDENIRKLMEEYGQFKEHMEPHLASFPATYRKALVSKHAEIEGELRAALADRADPPPPEVDEEPLAIDVVVAVDAPDDVAEVAMLLLPVVEHVHTAWSDREEDLQTWVAARAMQAIYRVCHTFGLEGAQAMYGGHQGLLAVEIELGAGDGAAVRTALQQTLDETFAGSPELKGARLAIHARPVDVDHLFPPEDIDAGSDAGDEGVSRAG
jgi:hypothetical protein